MKRTFTFLLLFITFSLLGNAPIQFHIECPQDVTVSCEDELWDLSIYGTAYAYGYGSPTPIDSPTVDYYLNDCNVGYIDRTWTATDYSGNIYSCTQTITVEPNSGYQDLNIQWPEDLIVNSCSANLDPGQLQPPYDYPTWNKDVCAMIMKNYSDAVFEVDKGCKKVLRTWKLIDWCTYDPNKPHKGGYWEHTQVLKVMSTDKPDISCIPDITVSSGSECYYTYVDLDLVTASNQCNSQVIISNNSPYADNNGSDASGRYPIGSTMIKFTARDACGNESDCKVKITVVDKKAPVPICLHGLSATLAVHHDGYYVRLYPELFNKGSYDNCTEKKDLKLRVEPEVLRCSDLDTAKVKLFVTDEEGNTNYCETYVYLTDNQNKCPDSNTVNGNVKVSNINLIGVDNSESVYNSLSGAQEGKPDNDVHRPNLNSGHILSSSEQASFAELSVFPNPLSNATATVTLYLPSEDYLAPSFLRIIGVDGKEYGQWREEWTIGQNQLTLGSESLNKLPKGIFILQLVTPHNTISKRIVNP